MWTDVMNLTVTELNSTSADTLIGFYPINHGDHPFTNLIIGHAFRPGVDSHLNGDIHLKADEAYSAFSSESRQFEMFIKSSLSICVYVCLRICHGVSMKCYYILWGRVGLVGPLFTKWLISQLALN